MPNTQNIIESNGSTPSEEHDEGLRRLVRRLDVFREPEGLLRALPTELSGVLAGNTLALVFCGESETPCWFAVDSNGEPIQVTPEITMALRSICSWAHDHRRPYVVSPLTRETPFSEL